MLSDYTQAGGVVKALLLSFLLRFEIWSCESNGSQYWIGFAITFLVDCIGELVIYMYILCSRGDVKHKHIDKSNSVMQIEDVIAWSWDLVGFPRIYEINLFHIIQCHASKKMYHESNRSEDLIRVPRICEISLLHILQINVHGYTTRGQELPYALWGTDTKHQKTNSPRTRQRDLGPKWGFACTCPQTLQIDIDFKCKSRKRAFSVCLTEV